MPSAAPPPTPTVGQRVSVGGSLGWVRYVGPVGEKLTQYAGVEWDADGRGKHDGSHGGTRHFTCAQGRGSFVKFKLLGAATSLVEALDRKYREGAGGSEDAKLKAVAATELYANSANGRQQCELVGMAQISAIQADLPGLERVSLRGMCIERVAPPGGRALSAVAPAVVELDLRENLLRRWGDVCEIGHCCAQLETLYLSGNAFDEPEGGAEADAEAEAARGCFASLRTLVVGSGTMDWPSLLRRARAMPQLRQLHFGGNGVVTLTVPGAELAQLEQLHLEDNCIADAAEVEKLGAMPSLRWLNLSGNPLETVRSVASPDGPAGFAALRALSLCDTALASWDAVVALDGLPQLAELWLKGCPLLDSAEPKLESYAARCLTVGRITRLGALNGGAIAPAERLTAEKMYLRHCVADLTAAGVDASQPPEALRETLPAGFAKRHPRFLPLCKHYDDVQHEKQRQAGVSLLSSNLVKVSIESHAAAHAERAAAQKSLPLTMTVGKLKSLCQGMYDLQASKMVVKYRDEGGDEQSLRVLDEWDNDLASYGVEDGGTVVVIDPSEYTA